MKTVHTEVDAQADVSLGWTHSPNSCIVLVLSCSSLKVFQRQKIYEACCEKMCL